MPLVCANSPQDLLLELEVPFASPAGLSLWLLGRLLGQVLLQSLLCTPPLVYFCRTGLCAFTSTLNCSICNSKSILSPNSPLTPKGLVTQVEDCNKLPQTQCLKQNNVILLQIRRSEIQNQFHWAEVQHWQGWFLLEAPRENPPLVLFSS